MLVYHGSNDIEMLSHVNLMKISAHSIVKNLMKLRNCDDITALKLFYDSQLYQLYADEETKMWHFSTLKLANILNEEIESGKLNLPVEG